MSDESDKSYCRLRGFQLMARFMSRQIPAKSYEEMLDFERAGGGVECKTCGLEYVEHPDSPEGPTFHILCDGRRVKL